MSSETRRNSRPIVVVTGANGGIGFSICHRLLVQLAHKSPPDARPQPAISRYVPVDKELADLEQDCSGCDGITVIMACRSLAKGESARTELLRLLDEDIAEIKKDEKNDGWADKFRANVQVDVARLDLAEMKSVFEFADIINSKYPYISHLVCNAGVASFCGYDWFCLIRQLFTEGPSITFSSPKFKLQRVGEKSADGLGWVWQCNVFGHYALFRSLSPLLTRYGHLYTPARVIWMSSIEALPSCYDPNDWQLIENDHSYEASKYEMDLLVGYFETLQEAEVKGNGDAKQNGDAHVNALANGSPPYHAIRHFVVDPGVVVTNFAAASLHYSIVLHFLMQSVFYLTHLFGSPHHVLSPFRAAISAVHLMLVSLPFVTATTPKSEGYEAGSLTPLKFNSKVKVWARPYVDSTEVEEWDTHREQSIDLARKCEELYQSFWDRLRNEEPAR